MSTNNLMQEALLAHMKTLTVAIRQSTAAYKEQAELIEKWYGFPHMYNPLYREIQTKCNDTAKELIDTFLDVQDSYLDLLRK